VDEKKKFELNDDMLESVSGGAREYTDGRTITNVTTKVRCTKCGTNKGVMYSWPDGQKVIFCSNPQGKHLADDWLDFSRVLVTQANPSDYTVGW